MFDLSSVIQQANNVATAADSNESSGSRLKLIYPQTGKLKVKLLYNPKSNLVLRLIKRHTVGNSKVACLSMYGKECPTCKSIDNIKSVTGADLWKLKAKSRGLSYAQYIADEGYVWDSSNPKPAEGELVLLMYPWSAYQDLNRIISAAGSNAYQLIASNEGKVINIIKYMEGQQIKYKCEVDAWMPNYKSVENDQDFEKFLNELPDLNEAVVTNKYEESMLKAAVDAGQTLERSYLKSAYPNVQQPPLTLSGINPNVVPNQWNQGGSSLPQQYNPQVLNNQYVPPTTPNNGYPNSSGGTYPPNTIIYPASYNQQPNPGPSSPVDTPPWVSPQGNQQYQQPQQAQQYQQPQPQQAQQYQQPQQNAQSGGNYQPTNNGKPMVQGAPNCFGSHKNGDPKCLTCLHEIQCASISG